MSEADHLQQERRNEMRSEGFFPLRVRVRNSKGQAITSHTVADNLCKEGMYCQLPHPLQLGQRLFAFIYLPEGRRIAARGRILRLEEKPCGSMGFAINFSSIRIINLPKSNNWSTRANRF